jgi:hypothetical protein
MSKRRGIIESEKAQRTDDQISPRLLPLKEAARYLGLSIWAMRERIWAGQIQVVRFPGGRKLYLDIKDLDRFIEKSKQTIE